MPGHRIGLTTVYRALQSLAEADEVDVLRNDDGEATYRACSAGHHHHLVCRSCGKHGRGRGQGGGDLGREGRREHGFVDVAHTVEVFGTCRQCAARGPGR